MRKTILLIVALLSGCVWYATATGDVDRTRRQEPPVVFSKTFDWSDYPEYPRVPEPGSFAFNEVRYQRRYRGYNVAKESLRSKYLLEELIRLNPGLALPDPALVDKKVEDEIAHFTGMGSNDPENPKNDPDDE